VTRTEHTDYINYAFALDSKRYCECGLLLLARLMGQYYLLAGVCRRLSSVVVVCRRL